MLKPIPWASRNVGLPVLVALLISCAAAPVLGQYGMYRAARRSSAAVRPSDQGPTVNRVGTGLQGSQAPVTYQGSKPTATYTRSTTKATRSWSARRNARVNTGNLAYNTYLKSSTAQQPVDMYGSMGRLGAGQNTLRSSLGRMGRSQSTLLTNIDTAARRGQDFFGVPASKSNQLRTSAQMGWVLPEAVTPRIDPAGKPDADVDPVVWMSANRPNQADQPDRKGPPTTETSSQKLAGPTISLEQLARNHLTSRQQDYADRAWEEFSKGEYQQAKSYFMLADSAAVNDPLTRPTIKLSLAYASLAAQEYTLAANALRWLLTPDPVTGEMPDPLVLNRIKDIRERYSPSARADYINQQEALNLFASRVGSGPEIRAIQALAAWGQGDRSNALFLANQLSNASEYGDWSRLAELMRRAEQASLPAGSSEDR